MIFVFGSNEAGRHGAGAAKVALDKHGALYGKGYGHIGNSFAIPSLDKNLDQLPLTTIKNYVDDFIIYAKAHPELEFQVTQIGCGLAGFQGQTIAPMFIDAPSNCLFDSAWKEYLPSDTKFWGTF